MYSSCVKISPACYLRPTWIIEYVGYLFQILMKLKLAIFLSRAFDFVCLDCHISQYIIYNTYNIRHIVYSTYVKIMSSLLFNNHLAHRIHGIFVSNFDMRKYVQIQNILCFYFDIEI